MHRQPLLDLLAGYTPSDQNDADARERIDTFVREHPDCFERSLLVGHVTGSAMIVDQTRSRALLTHHRKLDLWLQLGGHCDGDADVLRVAQKEALEESGLADVRVLSEQIFDVDVHAIPARPGEPEHFHHDVRFLFVADATAPLVVSEESHDLAWRDLSEICEGRHHDLSLRRMAAKIPR